MIIKDKGSAIKAYEELIETDLKIDMVNAQTKLIFKLIIIVII